jgi:hypothetical protein
VLTELRVRSKISAAALDSRKEKILTERDYDVLLTGPTRVLAPDGRPLCVYLPGVVKEEMEAAYPVLHTIRGTTDNRGAASATPGESRFKQHNMNRSKRVMSNILGSFEATGYYKFCRLTSWTAHQMDSKWPELLPLWRSIAHHFEEHVPDRHAAQMKHANGCAPDWMIPGTPFTTITVNNTYSTGVHQDKGDLDEGFSCLAVTRRGTYAGGALTFPEFRIAADMREGDLILMDAHQWHGNTQIVCDCHNVLSDGPCSECGAERISTVCYFRTEMVRCGTQQEESERAVEWAERRNAGPQVPAAG